MRKTKQPILRMKIEIDLASLHEFSTDLDVKKMQNSPPHLSKTARFRAGGFRKATLAYLKSAAGQAKRFGRWLQRMPEYLLDKFFFLSRLLIVIGFHLGAGCFLGLSILETLNSWLDVSWKPYAGLIAFGSSALASRLPKNKNKERD